MRSRFPSMCIGIHAGLAIMMSLLIQGCISPYESRHETQWDSRDQVWLSEASQVKLRAAQSRVFETTDRLRVLQAIIATLQDLNFQVEVLDEELGIVSGKKFLELEKPTVGYDRFYHFYDDQSLLVFTKTYRTWGPFYHRSNLVRLTVTIRARSESHLVVRASAQHYLRAVDNPELYQRFFVTLRKALFLDGRFVE